MFNHFYIYLARFQVDLENKIRIGMISSLPANISNGSMILENIEKDAKLLTGPTRDKPGPILLTVAITAEKFVSKSNQSTEIKNVEALIKNTYTIK